MFKIKENVKRSVLCCLPASLSRSELNSCDIANWEWTRQFSFALIYKPTCQYEPWHKRRLMSLAHCGALFLPSLPQRSRVQMTFVSHQMLRGRCHSVYCHGDLLVESDHSHGEEHIKNGARRRWREATECQVLPTTFIPSLSGLYILLLVIVWPSVVFWASQLHR